MAALGWLASRVITGARAKEKAEQLTAAAGLVDTLQRTGLSLDQARQLVRELSGARGPSPETLTALSGPIVRDGQPPVERDEPWKMVTTAALKFRLDARLTVLDAQMAEQIADLLILLSDETGAGAALEQAQAAWERYREAEQSLAHAIWDGGTGQTSAGLAVMIAVSEARLADLTRQKDQAKYLV